MPSLAEQSGSREGSVSFKAVIVACAAGAAVAGSVALTSVIDGPTSCPPRSRPAESSSAEPGQPGGHGQHHGGRDERHVNRVNRVSVGPTCNLVETATPPDSTYRPDVRRAPRADRDRARVLLRGVNRFCRTHSAAEITTAWEPGEGALGSPSHYFNPDRRGSLGLDPSSPRAALVYRQGLAGVMFTGTPLPSLGSIPRAHTHDTSRPREMLHVYCTPDLADAFTPSRERGVMADSIELRQKIRTLLPRAASTRLSAMLRWVREHTGDAVPPVEPSTVSAPEVRDPVARARRMEIRHSLLHLREPQLRDVLSMVRDATATAPRT